MKILWITSVYPSSLKPGEGVFHETQVQEPQKLGLDITVICPRPFHSAPVRMLKKAYRKRMPDRSMRLGRGTGSPAFLSSSSRPAEVGSASPENRISRFKNDETARHTSGSDPCAFCHAIGRAAAVVSESERIPYVLTLHGSDVNVYPHYSKGAFKAFNRAVGSASAVLAVSHKLQEETKTLSGFDSSVLPIGIQLSRFQENEQTKKKSEKTRASARSASGGLCGTARQGERHFELSEAIESLKEPPKAVFVGDGPAKSLLIQKGHIVTGQVPNHKVRDYLLAADMFVLPSYSEGMPTVVIEALALRVPVICTDVGGVASLFGKHQHLLIKPKSAQALAEAITLYEHEQIWKPEVADDLYEIVQAQFDAGKMPRPCIISIRRS